MPRVRFEPTIPVFERAKTVHALDRATTVIGSRLMLGREIIIIIIIIIIIMAPQPFVVESYQLCKRSRNSS
jgi:hypothetical protein